MDKRQELLIVRSNLEMARELGYKRYLQVQNTEKQRVDSTFDTAYVDRLKAILDAPKFDVIDITFNDEIVR